MNIKHKYGLINKTDEKMAQYGYGFMGYYNLKFTYEYTEEQMEQNRMLAEKLGHGKEWERSCDDARLMRSEHMKPIMDAIAKELVCYQYDRAKDDVDYHFSSADWDLFFWCDCIHNCFGEIVGDNRDMSYFTLGFNKEYHNKERQEEVLARVLSVLEQFADDENLCVIIEHDVIINKKKVREDSYALAPLLVGKKCTYQPSSIFPVPPVDGRVEEHSGVYYFMKKYARKRGFRLDPEDIIELAIQTGVKEAAA